MKAKLAYFRVDGSATVESARLDYRLIEMPDGPHPLTNDSVWQHAKRRFPPIVFFMQDVLPAYGASMHHEDIKTQVFGTKLKQMALKDPTGRMSKVWIRRIEAFFEFLWSRGAIILVALFIIYNVASAMFGGG